jgi:TatD DNase family protein
MFSDTHFHLQYLAEKDEDVAAMLCALAARDTAFALDIGTEVHDIDARLATLGGVLDSIDDPDVAKSITAFLRFSLGIWPHKESIIDRQQRLNALRADFERVRADAPLFSRIVALGECGLDHHWNPSGADKRNADDFDAKIVAGEAELFESLLHLARELTLPVIVHSRDAFDGTLSCISNVGYDCGVIHCYSYGIPEARAFLNRGWYISFSGAITYAKKSQADGVAELVRFVPRDRLLIETDAPYLAPVPHRGKTNTPILVEHVYRCAAGHLGISPEELSLLVDENAKALFGI